jgi:hypothetical protein
LILNHRSAGAFRDLYLFLREVRRRHDDTPLLCLLLLSLFSDLECDLRVFFTRRPIPKKREKKKSGRFREKCIQIKAFSTHDCCEIFLLKKIFCPKSHTNPQHTTTHTHKKSVERIKIKQKFPVLYAHIHPREKTTEGSGTPF